MTQLNSLSIVVVNSKGVLKAQYLIIIWFGIFIAEDPLKERSWSACFSPLKQREEYRAVGEIVDY